MEGQNMRRSRLNCVVEVTVDPLKGSAGGLLVDDVVHSQS